MKGHLDLPAPPRRALIVAVPGLGDALLATPLAASLQHAYPGIRVDMLVRGGSHAIVDDCPLLTDVLSLPRRAPALPTLRFAGRIRRRYDLALCTSISDRWIALAVAAAPRRLSILPPRGLQDLWKYALVQAGTPLDRSSHVISLNLRLIDALGIERSYEVAPPERPDAAQTLAAKLPFEPTREDYTVIHPTTPRSYKSWPGEHWKRLFADLPHTHRLVLTGGPDYEESALLADLAAVDPERITSTGGRLTFPEVSELLRGARSFIGTDTSVTHMAAALGTPTLALWGPSNLVAWSPWPRGRRNDSPPFVRGPERQRVGNVTVLGKPCECRAGTFRCPPDGIRRCMQSLAPEAVAAAAAIPSD